MCVKSHTLSLSREAVISKELGSDPLADLGETVGEAGGNWDFPWGCKHWQQPIYGSSFYHEDTGA